MAGDNPSPHSLSLPPALLPPGSSSDGLEDRWIFDFSQPEKKEAAFWFSGRAEEEERTFCGWQKQSPPDRREEEGGHINFVRGKLQGLLPLSVLGPHLTS